MRSMRGLPVPTSSGSRGWIGFGSAVASVILYTAPSKVVRSSSSSERTIWIASSKRCTRLPGGSSSMPYALCSLICQPAPMPSTMRPLEMWSIVVARLASTAGWCTEVGATSEPMRTRSVTGCDRRQHRPALVSVTRLDLLAAGVGHVVVGVPDTVPSVGVGPSGGVEHLGGGVGHVRPDRELHGLERNLTDRDRRRRPGPFSRSLGDVRRVVDRGLHWGSRCRVRGADHPARGARAGRCRQCARHRLWRRTDQPCARCQRRPRGRRSTRRGTRSRWPATRGGGPAFARATASELPFADASFDAVLACLVFEHIDAVDESIAEIARVVQSRWPIQLLRQSPDAADAGQRLHRRPHGRSSRAVLAGGPVPGRVARPSRRSSRVSSSASSIVRCRVTSTR